MSSTIKQDTLIASFERLLTGAGFDSPDVAPLKPGGNNRVYLISQTGRKAVLKAYFHHPEDPRDRLGAEFNFLRFAWDAGIRSIPEPLAQDSETHSALYEFVDGAKPSLESVNTAGIRQCLDFYEAINAVRKSDAAQRLNNASEACLSLSDHISSAAWRIERLKVIEPQAQIDETACKLINDDLLPMWARVSSQVESRYDYKPILPKNKQRLSPSDFGFHNAVRRPDGSLAFIDFEYAGWDDPAKMVCDFFAHPGQNVNNQYFDSFAAKIIEDLGDAEQELARIQLLQPLHQLKWICIILNEFLPVSSERRKFAAKDVSFEEKKQVQLEKAQRRLENLRTTWVN